ncbi:alpha/beta fold hydrolase [Rubellimicrobium rubrum]|uniref:Alpha/beta fold hydrolase n=1 Tax=Rubellimicrobium rubrum TaxID=2585369 RepID=A0A5C4N3F1_9RHOB|nr:alpha/beta hydrolase [Rubellimicrobium rubrum]TNC52468.1 alpha/beta fold hydrolase [Rubellimicrobium rubrum]
MDLSDAYANAAYIPDGEAFPARWAAAAQAFRVSHPAKALRYGDGEREWLHLFRPQGAPRGLMVFVHGGYWMRFSPEDFSHLAAGPLGQGWAVAMPAYPLCPDATVGGIVRCAARAVERASQEVEGPVVLTGHSAGGHVVARLACGDVTLSVRDRLVRVVPISPLANLLPLMWTGLNETLRLDIPDAVAESPLLRPRPAVPVAVWVGEQERPAFRDQALWLSKAWDASLVVEPGRHHFDVIEGLEHPGSALTRAIVGV